MPPSLIGVLGVMALDLFTYFGHVLLHKSWLGWQFHRVHHSDAEVNVTTAFRQHPGETVWRILWYALAVAVFGLPMGVVLVYLVISTLNAQLEHANTRYPAPLERLLRLLVVTPDMHKVHHSRSQVETDSIMQTSFQSGIVSFARIRQWWILLGFDTAWTGLIIGSSSRLPFYLLFHFFPKIKDVIKRLQDIYKTGHLRKS